MKLTTPTTLTAVPRLVWVLAAGRVVTSASSFVMLFLTLYLTGPRALSLPAAGLVVGISGAGLLAGNLTGGRWGDRHGHRRVLLAAASASGLLLIVVPLLPVPLLTLAVTLASYLGATAGTCQGALAALAVPTGDRRTAVAIGRAASNAGFVVGPPLGALLAAVSYEAVFVVEGAMLLIVRWSTAALLPADVDARSGPTDVVEAPGLRSLWRAVRADGGLWRLLPAIVLIDVVYRQLYTTLPVFIRDQGLSLGLYAGLIALGSGLILVAEIPVAIRLRHLPALPILGCGYALVGVGCGLFGLASAGALVAGMAVLTAGEILYKTTATAYVLDRAPIELTGSYQGLYTAAATSGTLLAAPLGGLLYAAAPRLLWPTCLLVALLAAALALRSDGRSARVSR